MQHPQSSDDALYFANSSFSDPDLFDTSEDPNGKNGTPQFKHRPAPRATRRSKPTSLQPGPVTNLTPGARRIP
jgi:hypothetical protein